VPDYQADEFTGLPLKQFGDPADPLLNEALKLTGNLATSTVTKNKMALNTAATTILTYHSAQERAAHAAPVNVHHLKQ
jgi:hypothetical protein